MKLQLRRDYEVLISAMDDLLSIHLPFSLKIAELLAYPVMDICLLLFIDGLREGEEDASLCQSRYGLSCGTQMM
ncbi:hypothetical protein SLA2020_267360 [Shorea laevis]